MVHIVRKYDDLLMLSGIQHIAYCERQWALIHVEQQWSENVLTIEGRHLHSRTDDPWLSESRPGCKTLRAVRIVSWQLGLTGIADVVELISQSESQINNTIALAGEADRWKVVPIEYKRGKPKSDNIDEVQLCAQAIALEETFKLEIAKGYLYYGQTRHRHEVIFSSELRETTCKLANQMHDLFEKGITPPPVKIPGCRSCSLIEHCLPGLQNKRDEVNLYLTKNLEL